jgi:hypothetical protein
MDATQKGGSINVADGFGRVTTDGKPQVVGFVQVIGDRRENV